jgi:hypothetical protein
MFTDEELNEVKVTACSMETVVSTMAFRRNLRA